MATKRPRGRPAQQEGASASEPLLAPEEVLASLAQLDLESALAYEAAVEIASDPEIRRKLREFSEDHRRHVEALNGALEQLGEGVLAAREPDRMPLLAGLARISGPIGPEALALALLANEQLTNLSCEDALAYQWDAQSERMLAGFRSDEERHMRWLSDKHDELTRAASEPTSPPPA
jgi:rubrerythrin